MLTGELTLDIASRDAGDTSRSIVATQYHRGALRVLRPFYPDTSGQPSVTIVNPGGGYLGGDRYRLETHIHEGAALTLTTQSATKVYRTPQGPAVMEQHFTLDKNARLEFVPDSIIAYREARFEQRTEVVMEPSASLILTEIVTPGWSPDGSEFTYDDLTLTTRVTVAERPVVIDRLWLTPAGQHPGPLMLGDFTHIGTLVVVDPRANDDAVAALREHLGVGERTPDRLIGLTRLSVPGFVLRVLTRSTPEAESVLRAAIDWMRTHWHGQPPLLLRKP